MVPLLVKSVKMYMFYIIFSSVSSIAEGLLLVVFDFSSPERVALVGVILRRARGCALTCLSHILGLSVIFL